MITKLWFISACVLLLLIFESSLNTIDSIEITIDNNGEEEENDFETFNEESVDITVVNNYSNESIALYWDGRGTDSDTNFFKIGDIEALEAIPVNTFVGHVFFALLNSDDETRAFPYQIVITPHMDTYSFGPIDTENKKSFRIKNKVIKPMNKKSTSVSAKFRCLAPAVDMWYDDGFDGKSQGKLKFRQESTINTYEGHVFYFTKPGNKSHVIARHTMSEDQVYYRIDDATNPCTDADLLKLEKDEEEFSARYFKQTGIHWRHFYGPSGPRLPPILYMWPAIDIGQIHQILSNAGFWNCLDKATCQSSTPLKLKLEVVSLQPKVFLIKNFLSDFESDHIISIAQYRTGVSSIGNSGDARSDDTRTSKNAWISRIESHVIETLFRRAADLLNIDEKLIRRDKNAEDLQVVHYQATQRYEPHHDWGVRGVPKSRYITLLLYLNDMEGPDAGGETAFPKGAGGYGFKVHPGKGNAILFYNLLEDGNADDLSLHSALPVLKGEKWKIIWMKNLVAYCITIFIANNFIANIRCIEKEASLAGDIVDNTAGVIPRKWITVYNNYDNQTISLYWDGDGADTVGSRMKMNDIERNGGSLKIETNVGHMFYAIVADEEEDIRVQPTWLTVNADEESYYFGPKKLENNLKDSLWPNKSFIKLLNERSLATSVKFRCLAPAIDIWYDDGKGGSPHGSLVLGQEATTNTYEGHTFFFTEQGNKSNVLATHLINKNQVCYKVTNPEHPAPRSLLRLQANEDAFNAAYFNRTGIPWRHFYGVNGPRPKPTLHMWSAPHIGYIHEVESNEGYWTCDGDPDVCQLADPIDFQVEVLSLQPRVFVINNFLSEYEIQEIINIAKPQTGASIVGSRDGGGARKSDTRTSRNAWISRSASPVTESLFIRAADVLNLDENILHNSANAEDMQVVHYVDGQKYESHHDWGVTGYPESRLITMLLYLTDMEDPDAGGETSFPKAANGLGFKVHPGKGNAILFYNLLEDGNGDDLALHAALPIHRGEKWLANFWVWDPKKR